MWSTLWKSPLNLCSDFVFPSHRSDLILQLLLILRIFNDAGGLDIFQTFWDILMFNQTVGYKHFTLECIVKREREVYPDNSHSNIHFLFARIPYISTHFYVLLCILIQCKGITLSFFCVGRWGSLTTVKGNDFFFFFNKDPCLRCALGKQSCVRSLSYRVPQMPATYETKYRGKKCGFCCRCLFVCLFSPQRAHSSVAEEKK